MGARLDALAAHRRTPWLALGLALILTSPALSVGWIGDDWFHRAILLHSGSFEDFDPLTDLFRFLAPGKWIDSMKATGAFPWFAPDNLHVGFFRPVAALTHMLDTALWPQNAWLQHAHSLLWFGGALLLAGLALRRTSPSVVVGGLATLLYAVDDGHAVSAGWLANRNGLMALVFGFSAFLAHIRWRTRGEQRWLWAALGLAAIGMLSAEAAVGGLAWIAAWQLWRDRGPLLQRALPLLPYVGLLAVWRMAYNAMGYGASGSGLYVDPGADPARFLGAVTLRAPSLLAGLLGPFPLDIWATLPPAGQWGVAAMGLSLLAGTLAVMGCLMRSEHPSSPVARFYLTGLLLSLVPVCATLPMDRVLGFAAFGWVGLLALAASAGFTGWRRFMTIGMLLLHGPMSAVLLSLRVAALPMFGALFDVGANMVPEDDAIQNKTVIFVNGSDFAAAYTPLRRIVEERKRPRRASMLAPAFGDLLVERQDARTLLITVKDGFLAVPVETLLRDPSVPFIVGESVARQDFSATVRQITEDGRPYQVAFTFNVPLEDPSLYWVAFTGQELRIGGHLNPWTPPAIGETVALPPSMPIP